MTNTAESAAALDALGNAADDLAAVPDCIRASIISPGFVTELRLGSTRPPCGAARCV